MSSERLDVLPDVPTVAEGGYPGFRAATWFGVAVPAGTPDDIVSTLNASLNRIMVDESFSKPFNDLGMVVQKPRTLAQVEQYVDQDRQAWGKLIEENQFSLD